MPLMPLRPRPSHRPPFPLAWPLVALTLATLALLSACASSPTAPPPTGDAIATAWPEAVPAALPGPLSTNPPTDWRELVAEPRLRAVIELALQGNRDLRSAVLAIEQARASYRIQEAAERPTLNGSAGLSASNTPAEASTSGQRVLARQYSVAVGITSYELDLFGRVKSLSSSALESYLNTEAARQSTELSLVAQVAVAWLTLAADQQQLVLARETWQSQQKTSALTEQMRALGSSTALAVAQARSALEATRVSAASALAVVEQDRHALTLLVGQTVPDELLPAGQEQGAVGPLVAVPAGLPASVLQRRPDVVAAEHLLQASHADLAAARAALYPRITLTTSAGTASRGLTDLFQGTAWALSPSITLPLLDGGAAKATVRKAEAAQGIQLASYEKTLQTAFKEVADALSVRRSLDERLQGQAAVVAASQQSADLALARFRGGADTFLTVLDAQRTLYSAQQALITLQLTEQSNRITLYKVLGGGWAGQARAPAGSVQAGG